MEEQALSTVIRWTNGTLVEGEPSVRIRGISTDTRTVKPGELFIALRGKNYDGNEFIPQALRRGAVGVVVDREDCPPRLRRGGPAVIRVRNTEQALVDAARAYRRTLKLKAIAVTGSNGKTTTKNLIGLLLGGKLKTLVSPKSFNNRIGVSLTLFQLDQSHRAAVFEVGANHEGEIYELGEICRPEIGVVLNVGPAHLGFFGSLSAVAREKSELLRTLKGNRTAVLNLDDRRVRGMAKGFGGRAVGFGLGRAAAVRAERVILNERGSEFNLVSGSGSVPVRSPLPGPANVYNVLAATATAGCLGVGIEEVRDLLGRARLPRMRLERLRIGGVLFINDAYNANPASMRTALEVFRLLRAAGKKILVSGDMNELGKHAEREHRAWGASAAAAGLDYLVFVGSLSRHAARSARKQGFPARRIFECADAREAAGVLRRMVAPGDAVLLKASRFMALERILDCFPRASHD